MGNPGANDPNVVHRIIEVAPSGETVAEIELQSFGKAVQYRSHLIQSIAGERLIKVGDVEDLWPERTHR
jgi:hypothetical protein